jgi:hypothetical protein
MSAVSIEQRAETELSQDRCLFHVDLNGFMQANPEPPEFVVYPLIPRGVPTLLGAHGGGGKTMLALTLGAHVAVGRDWGGFPVERGRVLIVSLEDRASLMRYRLRKVVECYGLDQTAVAQGLLILDGTDVDGAMMTEVNDHGTRTLTATPIMLEVEEAAEGAALVIVDNASDGFDGNENERRQVRAFMRRLSGIAKANNAGIVLLAHIDKQAARSGSHGNSYSGSTAWHNSARSRLAMLADESGSVELVHEKCNLAKLADPVRLAWSESGVLVPVRVDPSAEGASDDMRAKADAEHVLSVVRVAIGVGITVPTAASGPSTSWHALQPLPELAQVYRAKDGKRRVLAALIRLGRDGSLIRGTFKTSYRNERECWTLPDSRTGGEKITTKSAAHISPIPPTALPQRRGRAVVVVNGTTSATSATPACPRCDGEGCKQCRVAAL